MLRGIGMTPKRAPRMAEGAYLAEQMLKHVFSPCRGLFSILGYMIGREICFPAIKKTKRTNFFRVF